MANSGVPKKIFGIRLRVPEEIHEMLNRGFVFKHNEMNTLFPRKHNLPLTLHSRLHHQWEKTVTTANPTALQLPD